MNIISNNCCGGYFYNFINEKQKNPFRFTHIFPEKLYNLIQNYDKINFSNYELYKELYKDGVTWFFYLNIDDKLIIRFSHYKYDKNYAEPTKVGENILYCKIWEFIIEQYERRLKLMTEEPYFIIDFGAFDDNEECMNDFLKLDFKRPTVLIVYNEKYLNYNKENLKIIYSTKKMVPVEVINKFGNEIKDFFDIQ